MKQVLFLNPYYYPGYRSGGPQRTLMNIADTFGDVCDLRILTRNHDMGESAPYPDVPVDEWVQVGKAKVKYLTDQKFSFRELREEYGRFERVYTCGLFEKNTLLILPIHRFSKKKKELYVAPMGVFSAGAIGAKRLKKRLFLLVYGALGMFRDITWSFTSSFEMEDAKRELGRLFNGRFLIAEDLPRQVDFEASLAAARASAKEKGKLRVIFLSRICPKKNPLFCAEVLRGATDGEIQFDVYGTQEDPAYWAECRAAFDGLPANVSWRYCGPANAEDVPVIFRQYDVFLFPTKGENYGHVIYEALAAGCLPVLADTTPWRDLDAAGCGQVLPFGDAPAFQAAVRKWLAADRAEMSAAKERAVRYAEEKAGQAVRDSGYRQILT